MMLEALRQAAQAALPDEVAALWADWQAAAWRPAI